MVGRLLVITGASGVGKSTLTTRVASALEFEKIASTDTVREILRTQLGIEAEPALHRSSFQPAGSGAIEDWRATIVPLSDGIEAVIERARKRGSDLLLEGVHIAPSFTLLDDWRAA
jgi:2-phosphoglycerate kinase